MAVDLEELIGSKPFIGFNWSNGSLTAVSVNFDDIPQDKSLSEISDLAELSIEKQFNQVPNKIVISFTITPSD